MPVTNDASTTYRVVANNFLSDGGDGFAAFTTATDKYIGGLDIDAFADYLPPVRLPSAATDRRHAALHAREVRATL